MSTTATRGDHTWTVLYSLARYILVVGYPPTAKELSVSCRLNPATTKRYLDQLVTEDLVRYIEDKRDARAYVGLTAEGWSILEEVIKQR